MGGFPRVPKQDRAMSCHPVAHTHNVLPRVSSRLYPYRAVFAIVQRALRPCQFAVLEHPSPSRPPCRSRLHICPLCPRGLTIEAIPTSNSSVSSSSLLSNTSEVIQKRCHSSIIRLILPSQYLDHQAIHNMPSPTVFESGTLFAVSICRSHLAVA